MLPDHIPDAMEGPSDISFADDPDVEAKEEERERRLRELPKTMDEIMKKYGLGEDQGEEKPEEDESSEAFVHPYERAMGQLSNFMNKEYRETAEKTRKCLADYNSVLKVPSISKVVFGSFPESAGTGQERKRPPRTNRKTRFNMLYTKFPHGGLNNLRVAPHFTSTERPQRPHPS